MKLQIWLLQYWSSRVVEFELYARTDLALAFFYLTKPPRWLHNAHHVLRILVRCCLRALGGALKTLVRCCLQGWRKGERACEFRRPTPIQNHDQNVSNSHGLQRWAWYMIAPFNNTLRGLWARSPLGNTSWRLFLRSVSKLCDKTSATKLFLTEAKC